MELSDYNDTEIKNILNNYKNARDRQKKYYDSVKDKDEFKIKNRTRAKNYYHGNLEFVKSKNSYNYYKRNNKLEQFKEKCPDKYEILLHENYFNDKNPAGSTSVEDPK